MADPRRHVTERAPAAGEGAGRESQSGVPGRRESAVVAGRNPVREALRSGQPIRKVQVSRHARLRGTLAEIVEEARRRGIPVQFVDPRHLDQLSATGAHQGVVALVAVRPLVDLEDLLERARSVPDPLLVLVDGVEDPRNLGAILRTAEAAGAVGAVIPTRRSAGLSPAVAKASAGAALHLPVAGVSNMARAVQRCQEAGFRVVAADPRATLGYDEADLDPPVALVVGGEERGVRRLVRERCDQVVRIPMRGKVESLNASVAAAILLYEVVRRLRARGRGREEGS